MKTRNVWLRATVTLIAAALVASACGSDSSESAGDSASGGTSTSDATGESESTDPDSPVTDDEDVEVGSTYRIGIAVSATGPASGLGAPEQATFQLLEEQVTAGGGVTGPDGVLHPVEFIYLDNETNPDAAASSMSRLVTEDTVDIVLGGTTSGNSLAMLPIATENETAFVSLASAGSIVRDPESGAVRPWIFKTVHINDNVAELVASYIGARGATSVCYLAENTGYGQDVLNTASAAFDAAGLEIAFSDVFEREETEFPQTVSIGSAGCDTVVIGSLMPAAVNANAALLDALPDVEVIHSSGICNGGFLSLDPTVVEGVTATCPKLLVPPDSLPDDDPQKGVLSDYRDAYEAFSGEPVNSFGGHAWDAGQWALLALSSLEDGLEGAERRSAIRDALESEVDGYVGTGGVFTLSADDHVGITDTKTALTTVRVVDGAFAALPESEWAN